MLSYQKYLSLLNRYKHILLILITLVSTLVLSSEEEKPNQRLLISSKLLLNNSGSDFTNLGDANSCCPGFTSSSGMGLSIGLNYLYPINSRWSIISGIGYNDLSSDFIVNENEIINLNGDNPVDARIEQKVTSTLSAIFLNFGAEYSLTEKLDIAIGYMLSIPSDLEYQQTEKIIAPNNALFDETNSKTRTNTSGSIENSILHSLFTNVAYRLYTDSDKNSYLRPNIGYTFGLNSVNQEMSLTPNNFNIGLDFAYGLGGGNSDSDNNDGESKSNFSSELETSIPENQVIDLAFNEQSETLISNKESGASYQENPTLIIRPLLIDDKGKRQEKNFVYINEVKSKRLVPVLNYIFFDKDSTKIPIRYSSISNSETKNFNLDSLFDVSTLDIYHHVLNIVGKRMKENPNAKLKIVGTKSDDETNQNSSIIAIERAKSVQSYLVNNWKVNINRLELISAETPKKPSVGKTDESKEENRRVELYSNDENILKPVLLSDLLYRPITKEMKFYTVVDTNLNNYNWQLEINDDEGNLIFEDDGGDEPPLSLNYLLNEKLAHDISNKKRLRYRFSLIDDQNERQSLTGDFNIIVNTIDEKNSRKEKDIMVDKYSLILFDYDGYKLEKSNSKIINLIKSNINTDSKLRISGYTDKIGSPEYNKSLSEKRVQSVANEFESQNIENLYHYGETVILFNNKLPEGRFYSRTVEIEVITPIK